MAEKPGSVIEAINAFAVDEGHLVVNGLRLDRLAAQLGQTPFYAYDRAKMTERVQLLRRSLPAAAHIHYAMKANPMPAVVQHLRTLVDGIDVASAGEMQTALDSGMPADRISFAGPGKRPEELARAVAAGITINLESAAEMRIVARIGRAQGRTPRVAVRVNPDFELKASGMRMGGGAQQFGVDAVRVPAMLRSMPRLGLRLEGFHIFAGSQNLRPELIVEAQEKAVNLALSLARIAGSPIRHINIGGGFGIPYFPGDRRLDLSSIGDALGRLASRVADALPDAHLVIELGRYLVGEAGIYVCRVIDRKISRGETFLVTDGGLHHHLAASGNFGQVIRRNFPIAVGNRMGDNRRETVNVVGPLCTPLDLLGSKVELPPAKVGDFIVVFQSGAYGRTASPLGFLSHPAPMEALV